MATRPPEKDADGRFHFSEREYYATRELFGIVSTFNKNAEQLERRVREIPGGWRDLKLIMAVSEKLMKGILRTIPKKKLAVIQKELTNTEVLVNVRNAIAPMRGQTRTDSPMSRREPWRESRSAWWTSSVSAVRSREPKRNIASSAGILNRPTCSITPARRRRNARLRA